MERNKTILILDGIKVYHLIMEVEFCQKEDYTIDSTIETTLTQTYTHSHTHTLFTTTADNNNSKQSLQIRKKTY